MVDPGFCEGEAPPTPDAAAFKTIGLIHFSTPNTLVRHHNAYLKIPHPNMAAMGRLLAIMVGLYVKTKELGPLVESLWTRQCISGWIRQCINVLILESLEHTNVGRRRINSVSQIGTPFKANFPLPKTAVWIVPDKNVTNLLGM